jgi:hypothetical protein
LANHHQPFCKIHTLQITKRKLGPGLPFQRLKDVSPQWAKRPSFVRSPLGIFIILAFALMIVVSIILICHFGFDIFEIKTRSESDDGTSDGSRTLQLLMTCPG